MELKELKKKLAIILSAACIFSNLTVIQAEEEIPVITDEPAIESVEVSHDSISADGAPTLESGDSIQTDEPKDGDTAPADYDEPEDDALRSNVPIKYDKQYGDYILTIRGDTLISANQCQGTGATLYIPKIIRTIAKDAVSENSVLTTVEFEEGTLLTMIEENAFKNDTGLTTFEFHDTLLNIGKSAFEATNIPSFTFPSKLRHLGTDAFKSTSSLTRVYGVPVTLQDCTGSLEEDFYKGHAPFFGSAVSQVTFQDNIQKIPNWLFCGCFSLHDVTIPTTVTTVGEYAFCRSGLNIITLPNNVTTVEADAFDACLWATKLIVSKTSSKLAVIGDEAFSNCWALETIVLPNELATIGDSAFLACNALTEITFPDSLEELGTTKESNSFAYCTSLETVNNIPLSLKDCTGIEGKNEETSQEETAEWGDAGRGPFYACNQLENVTFHEGITKIPAWLFHGCPKLTAITIPATVTTIGKFAFAYSGLESITIPNKVSEIQQGAFKNCYDLTAVNISKTESNLTVMGDEAFKKCTKLPAITLPNKLTTISDEAFMQCKKLATINFPASVATIGDQAFFECKLIKEVTLPVNLRQLGTSDESNVFAGCVGLTTVKGIPATLNDCTGDEEGETGPFAGCYAIRTVQFLKDVKRVPAWIFYKCNGIQEVTLPSSVTSIGNNAFGNCGGLGRINIPKLTKRVEKAAFDGCVALAQVDYEGTKEDWGKIKIEKDNEPLKNAKIKYNISPDPQCTVAFNPNGGTGSYASQTVNNGQTIIRPNDPMREGYIFDGWHINTVTAEEWKFSDPVTCSMTLIAKWDELTATVTFDGNGAPENPKSQKVRLNGKAQEPDIERIGYRLCGWHIGSEFGPVWDFNNPVTGDMKLVAEWEQSVFDFNAETDSNSYAPSEGSDNYSFNSADTLLKLTSGRPAHIISDIIKRTQDKRQDTHYGVTSTIGLAYNQTDNVSGYSGTNAANYRALPSPKNDAKMSDAVNYYHFSQTLDNNHTISKGDEKLPEFLQGLARSASMNKATALSYFYGNNKFVGHTILAMGCNDDYEGNHIIELYNSDDYQKAEPVTTMTITKDWKAFSFTGKDGQVTQENFKYLKYDTWDGVSRLTRAKTSDAISVSDDGLARITLRSNVTINSNEGHVLTYKDGEIEGNLEVIDITPISQGNSSYVVLTVMPNPGYTVTGERIDVSFASSKGYMSLETTDIPNAIFSWSNGIEINGDSNKEYTFRAFMQTENDIQGTRKGLCSIEGKAKGKVNVKKSGKDMTATASIQMASLTLRNYFSNTYAEERILNAVTDISVDSSRKGSPVSLYNTESIETSLGTITVTWRRAVSFNGTKHVSGTKSGKSKTSDLEITVRRNGSKLKEDNYKITYKNNKNVAKSSGKQPHFKIKLKDVDKAANKDLKNTPFAFDITPATISSDNISYQGTKAGKNGTVLKKAKYSAPNGRQLKMKPLNVKGKGDYTVTTSGNMVVVVGKNNYTGTVELK